MLAEVIRTPEDYLAYSKKILADAVVLENYKKIEVYYDKLCLEFKEIYYSSENFFQKWGKLLAIDAQIQILLELIKVSNGKFPFELEEEKLIHIIQKDKNYFYREITGGSMNETPKWGLIYLSEE